MGLFVVDQPQYAERGVVTFPVTVDQDGKRPAVRGYPKIGPLLSAQLRLKFPHHDALGFMCGPRNAITVLDVDSDDECIFADAIADHGPTPWVVKSPSDHFQALYRHDGEGRHIRPWPDVPIVILGGG